MPEVDDVNHAGEADRLGWTPADRPARLRLVCDAYGFGTDERTEVLNCLSDTIARGGEFVRRRVEAGEAAFIEMWNDMGGQARFDQRRRWWTEHRRDFERALS